MTADKVASLASRITGCFLCGDSPIQVVGTWVPKPDTEAAALVALEVHRAQGHAPRHTPSMVYGLCAHCVMLPDTPQRVEAKALASLRGEKGQPS